MAKIRAIHGKMLTETELIELAHKKSVGEAAEFLKTVYRFKDTLAAVDSSTIHRGYLEELLEKSTFELYRRLCSFQQLDNIPFYNYIVEKYEIEQILSMINNINSNVEGTFINTLPAFLMEASKLPYMEIAGCESYGELTDVLKGTPYGKILKAVPLGGDGLINYPVCEQKLRTFYYERLFDNIDKSFSKHDSKVLSDYIKTDIDLINVVNAYRLKKFFGYRADHIKERMLPFTKRGKAAMNAFYCCETAEDMLELIKKLPLFGNGVEIEMIEISMGTVRMRLADRLLTASQSAPVVMYAFMTLCSIETRNIIKIIEGIRYSLPPTEIEKLITA